MSLIQNKCGGDEGRARHYWDRHSFPESLDAYRRQNAGLPCEMLTQHSMDARPKSPFYLRHLGGGWGWQTVYGSLVCARGNEITNDECVHQQKNCITPSRSQRCQLVKRRCQFELVVVLLLVWFRTKGGPSPKAMCRLWCRIGPISLKIPGGPTQGQWVSIPRRPGQIHIHWDYHQSTTCQPTPHPPGARREGGGGDAFVLQKYIFCLYLCRVDFHGAVILFVQEMHK